MSNKILRYQNSPDPLKYTINIAGSQIIVDMKRDTFDDIREKLGDTEVEEAILTYLETYGTEVQDA